MYIHQICSSSFNTDYTKVVSTDKTIDEVYKLHKDVYTEGFSAGHSVAIVDEKTAEHLANILKSPNNIKHQSVDGFYKMNEQNFAVLLESVKSIQSILNPESEEKAESESSFDVLDCPEETREKVQVSTIPYTNLFSKQPVVVDCIISGSASADEIEKNGTIRLVLILNKDPDSNGIYEYVDNDLVHCPKYNVEDTVCMLRSDLTTTYCFRSSQWLDITEEYAGLSKAFVDKLNQNCLTFNNFLSNTDYDMEKVTGIDSIYSTTTGEVISNTNFEDIYEKLNGQKESREPLEEEEDDLDEYTNVSLVANLLTNKKTVLYSVDSTTLSQIFPELQIEYCGWVQKSDVAKQMIEQKLLNKAVTVALLEKVVKATNRYFCDKDPETEEDSVEKFVKHNCSYEKAKKVKSSELYEKYKKLYPFSKVSRNAFTPLVKLQGFVTKREKDGIYWINMTVGEKNQPIMLPSIGEFTRILPAIVDSSVKIDTKGNPQSIGLSSMLTSILSCESAFMKS